jgi:hypothetical protein
MGLQTPSHDWRPIPGFVGIYEISDFGEIRRLKGGSGAITGRIQKANPNRDGYPRAYLKNAPNAPVYKLVHVLVCEIFIGPRPPGMESCHFDGDPSNCALTNLRWDTPLANAADKRRHGKVYSGEHHANSKLTDAQVRELRVAPGSQRAIARQFGITQQTVSDIRIGRRRALSV